MKQIICIARGHGFTPDGTFDPGTTTAGHTEHGDVQAAVVACTDVLRANVPAGWRVESEGDMGGKDPNWAGTEDWANDLDAAVVVSLHEDWDRAPEGLFTIQTSDEGRRLGWAIEARCAQAGFAIREYQDDRNDLGLLNQTNMTAVIVELGRIGSEPIDTPEKRARAGEAIAYGIMDYLGITPDRRQPIPPEEDDDMPLSNSDLTKIRDIAREEANEAVQHHIFQKNFRDDGPLAGQVNATFDRTRNVNDDIIDTANRVKNLVTKARAEESARTALAAQIRTIASEVGLSDAELDRFERRVATALASGVEMNIEVVARQQDAP